MATAIGHQGLISAPDTDSGAVDQTGFDLHHILAAIGPSEINYTVSEPELDNTVQATSAPTVMAFASTDLKSWTGTVGGKFPGAAPKTGNCGNLTFASGYTNKVQAWTMDLTCEAFLNTGMAATCPTWEEFTPGLVGATGTYTALIDSATAVPVSGDTGAATFRMTDESGTDNTLACSIVVTGVQQSVTIGSRQEVTFTYRVVGAITAAGDTTLFEAGAIGTPDVTEVEIRKVGSRIDTANCFWTSVGISVSLRDPIRVTLGLQGTGALVPA